MAFTGMVASISTHRDLPRVPNLRVRRSEPKDLV